MGTLFVSFTDNLTTKDAIKVFKTYLKEHTNIKSKFLINDWIIEGATVPANIDWKNLAYDRYHRITRVIVVALTLLLLGFALVYPF